jgi:hypothetical protein
VLIGLLLGLSLAAAPTPTTCQNLHATATLRPALVKAHARPKEGVIAPGSLYYGRCGTTQYAIGSFTGVGGDGPEKFVKLAGKPWKDLGDGFEGGCSQGARYPIPYALVRLWGFC